MHARLHHLGLTVGDVDATAAALASVFDAERLEAPVTGHALIRLGDIHLALVPLEGNDPANRPRGDHLALALPADQRNVAVARLEAAMWSTQEVQGRVYARSPDGTLTLELLAE